MMDYNAPMPPAESLSLAEVNARPVWVDWTNDYQDERWEAWEAVECDDCGHTRVVESPGGGEPCDIEHDDDEAAPCEGELPETEGPMMSWAWPVTLRRGPEDAAESLTHLPVCVVEYQEHGTLLALTGGGMDLSWELCEAYIRLGLAPPFALCDLPRMAGRGESDHDRRIIEACQRSCEHVVSDAQGIAARLAINFG